MYSYFLKIFFTFTNSVDPDKMQHYAAFHLGLPCLQKNLFRGFSEYKGLRLIPCESNQLIVGSGLFHTT